MDKVWLENYSRGVPAEIDLKAAGTLVSILEESFKRFPQCQAFDCANVAMSYGELDVKSKAFAAYLQYELKLEKGMHIALMAPNILPFPVALVGALRVGLVVVNVNPMYTAHELEHQLADSQAKAIIIYEPAVTALKEIVGNTQVEHVIVISPADLMGEDEGIVISDAGVSNVAFLEALAVGATKEFSPVRISQDDLAFLQYTGGTTGLSKGAMLTHGNVAININQVRSWYDGATEDGSEVIITALPLYHIFGLTFNLMYMTLIGGCNLLIPNPKDMDGMISYLKDKRFTLFTAVNTLFNGMLHHKDIAELDFSHLKFCVAGGAALQQAVYEGWLNATGVSILEGYGLSETSPVLTVTPFDQADFKGSIGLPLPSTELCIMDDDGNELGFGEEGELCARGPQVMQGYWQCPEATAEVMTMDNYFRTGDIAHVDGQGYFRIVDRKKDMILVSGFNVYPNEIEDAVAMLPDIIECACVGVPDEKSGEAVKVFAVKEKDSGLNEDEVRTHCRESLAAYKVPKHVAFIDALPKSTVGKILRRELR